MRERPSAGANSRQHDWASRAERRTIHIPDVLADPEYEAQGYQQSFGYRTNLGVPLLREGDPIGVFSLTRDAVNPFTDKEIELVTTFADQAVIAIENVRLFDEVKARTEELTNLPSCWKSVFGVLLVVSRVDHAPMPYVLLELPSKIFLDGRRDRQRSRLSRCSS